MNPIKKEDISEYGKIFTSYEGDLTVELVLLKEKNDDDLNDAIIRVIGQEAEQAGINREAIFYEAELAGTGFNFTFKKDGERRNRFGSRATWYNFNSFDIYLNGKTIGLRLNEELTKDFKPLHLLTDFQMKENTYL